MIAALSPVKAAIAVLPCRHAANNLCHAMHMTYKIPAPKMLHTVNLKCLWQFSQAAMTTLVKL